MSFGQGYGGDLGTLSVYAGWWPGGTAPGMSAVPPDAQQGVGTTRDTTENRLTLIRQTILEAWENWLPFTWSFMGRYIVPRAPTAPWQSPYDVDASERITRQGPFPSAERPFPYPYEIGAVSGFMPMLDQYSMAWAYGKTPSGPGVLTPIPIPDQASYPNLQKVTG